MLIDGYVINVEAQSIPEKAFMPPLSSVRLTLRSETKIWRLKLGVLESHLLPMLTGNQRFEIKTVKDGFVPATWLLDENFQPAKRPRLT